MTKQLIVKGHTLVQEGKAEIDERGKRIYGWMRFGCGLCSCGATSPVLDSDAARKRWHRAHKTEMAKAAQA